MILKPEGTTVGRLGAQHEAFVVWLWWVSELEVPQSPNSLSRISLVVGRSMLMLWEK